MAHGNVGEGKWKGTWPMQWVASTLHTTSEHGVSSITTADAHTSAACSRLNWRTPRIKWTRPFRRKTNSGFCACGIRFRKQSTFGRYVCDKDECRLIFGKFRYGIITELLFRRLIQSTKHNWRFHDHFSKFLFTAIYYFETKNCNAFSMTASQSVHVSK
jgi:hypothetical protein